MSATNASVMAFLCLFISAPVWGDISKELPADVVKVLEAAEDVEVLGIHPEELEKPEKDDFRGYRVLERVTIKDKANRTAVVTATLKSVKESDGSLSKCFEPRHGIRAVHEKKTVELLICFACSRIEVFVDGKHVALVSTTNSASATLDKVLKPSETKKE